MSSTVQRMPDRAETSPIAPRWHAALVAEELPPLNEPVAALMSADGRTWAWVPESGRIRPVPDLGDLKGHNGTPFVEPGGRYLLLESEGLQPDDGTPMLERRFSKGIYRLDLADLSARRLPFEPRAGWEWRNALATSPDGQQVVIAEEWRPDEYYSVARRFGSDEFLARARALTPIPAWVTVHRVDLRTSTSEVLLQRQEWLRSGSEDSPVQWSPDGSLIALSLTTSTPGVAQTLLIDASTGAVVRTIEDARLAGSLGWSPSGARLLLDRHQIVEYDIASGEDHPLPPLPGAGSSTRRPEPPGNGRHRVLGYADEEHLLSVTHRRTVMMLNRVGIVDGAVKPLARWAGTEDIYPRLTAMPPGFWN